MTWTQIRRQWAELKGKAKETWSRLSQRELEAVRGFRDRLIDKVQEAYGIARRDAERQVEAFARKVDVVGRAAAGAALGAAANRLDRMRASVERGRRAPKTRAAARRPRVRRTSRR
jgi:uncharacterized protein YjbJ (UPF0337 family)